MRRHDETRGRTGSRRCNPRGQTGGVRRDRAAPKREGKGGDTADIKVRGREEKITGNLRRDRGRGDIKVVVEQVRVKTRKFGGSNARRESAEEVGDTGSYAIPEDGVKGVGGKNPRGLTTDGVAVEQEGG